MCIEPVTEELTRRARDAVAQVFTSAEIVELGMQTAGLVGLHRFLGTLDLMSSAPAAVAFDPSDVHALEDAR